ncbi:hypothetical protein JCM31447_16330 [Fluviispira sanaruensis]|uniref:DUF790 family protein n=1 Tax=Fluviispira sanaruensis TaxID=2493639 RepID=A0A4P2VMR4_FLUSA|nr:hypothetical protein JCM31447_16330 [Fluviispira sanaruensis]
MLTKKELLRYKKSKGKIIPQFIDVNDILLNEYAEDLINIFLNAVDKKRKEIEDEISHLNTAYDLPVELQKGFTKLLFDKLEFKSTLGDETSVLRNKIFQKSSDYFNSKKPLDLDEYLESIAHEMQLPISDIKTQLYSDLPEFHVAVNFKAMAVREFLNFYNLSLIQGLLFYSAGIQIKIPIKEQAKLEIRYLLKQMRFFQLVANIQIVKDYYEIILDGPLSLFVHTQKYGLNLASFFPSLVLLTEWDLFAFIELSQSEWSKGELKLSHKNNLVSHYKNFSAFVPEEFKLFSDLFTKKNTEWNISLYLDEIFFDGLYYYFPDYEFKKCDRKVYIELFHPWHKKALIQRIHSLEKNNQSNLMLGVVKSLLKDKEIQVCVEQSQYFTDFGFIFREMPTVSQVSDLLKRFE